MRAGACAPTWDASVPDAGGHEDAGPLECDHPQADCGGDECVDLTSAFDHCGQCESACEEARASVCNGGACRCGDEERPCAGDVEDRCCEGECTNLLSNDAHCGECGNGCDDPQAPTCDLRTCVCGTSARTCAGTPEDSCCAGLLAPSCIDTTSDPANCGGCGVLCADAQAPACVGGACTCGTSARACAGTPEDSCCETDGAFSCTDTGIDPAHCGACGEACDPDVGTNCVAATCLCGALGIGCGGSIRATCCGEGTGAELCADLLTDEVNCGACDRRCEAPTSNHCRNGACVCGIPADIGVEAAPCAEGEECCGVGVDAVCVPAGSC